MANSEFGDLFEKLDNGLVDQGKALSPEEKEQLLMAFCRVQKPEERHMIEFIVMKSDGRKGGVSRKPGNITLNWRMLFGALPGIALTGVGVTSNSWILIFGALVIWKDLYATAKVELDPEHAIAMNVMWNNHDGKKRISEDEARSLTNEALDKFDLNQVSKSTFAGIIDDLSNSGCIELSNGEIWLREWIQRRWP